MLSQRSFTIRNMYISKGGYEGDLPKALKYIEYFIATKEVKYNCRGHGYADITAGDSRIYSWTPGSNNRLDINLMIMLGNKYADIKFDAFNPNDVEIPAEPILDRISRSCSIC